MPVCPDHQHLSSHYGDCAPLHAPDSLTIEQRLNVSRRRNYDGIAAAALRASKCEQAAILERNYLLTLDGDDSDFATERHATLTRVRWLEGQAATEHDLIESLSKEVYS